MNAYASAEVRAIVREWQAKWADFNRHTLMVVSARASMERGGPIRQEDENAEPDALRGQLHCRQHAAELFDRLSNQVNAELSG